jgi:DNA-directed RNA polymerase specialized sigma subunit
MRKEDLKEYRHICMELRRLDDERIKWRARAEYSARPPSMAPALGGQHDPMPLIMDRLTEIQNRAKQLIPRLADMKRRIEQAIAGLPSLQRQLMHLRYIEAKRWFEISEAMSYSEQRLYELHKEALSNIKFLQAKRNDCGKIIPKEAFIGANSN